MFEMKIDTSKIDRILERWRDTMPQAIEIGLDDVTDVVLNEKHRQIQKTYARPAEWEDDVTRTVYHKKANSKGELFSTRTTRAKWRKTHKYRAKWKRKGMAGGWAGSQVVIKSNRRRLIKDSGACAEPIKNYPKGYAQKLASLPKSPDGVRRANPAAKTTMKITRPQIAGVFEASIRKGLIEQD